MPSTALDSNIFRDIFTTAEMRDVFSDEYPHAAVISKSRRRSRACRGAWASSRRTPRARSFRNAKIENIDFAKLKTQTERIGYPILGVVQQIVALCDKGLGEWCHWGATTQDITDTATIMQVRAALDLVEAEIEKIAAALAELVAALSRYADGRAQQSAAGGADHVRLQDRVAARGVPAPSPAAEGNAPARAGRRIRRRGGTLSSLGADGLKVQAGADGRTEARPAGNRLAHGARPHRRGRLFPWRWSPARSARLRWTSSC